MKDINARECLCEALCRLAQDTPVENISVSRLAERAGVSRAAFYYHFESTCAVLEYMMDSFSREYQRLFIATPGESMDGITPERHREIEHAIFSYVLPRAEWVKLFLQEWNYRRFIGRFREQFQTFCQMHRVMCVCRTARRNRCSAAWSTTTLSVRQEKNCLLILNIGRSGDLWKRRKILSGSSTRCKHGASYFGGYRKETQKERPPTVCRRGALFCCENVKNSFSFSCCRAGSPRRPR